MEEDPIRLTDAQQALVEQKIALVYHVSKRYTGIPHEDYLDLVTTLKHRLCVTVASFDPSLGYQISPFVVRSLVGEAKDYFRDKVWVVRPPRSLRDNWTKYRAAQSETGSPLIMGEDAEVIATCLTPTSLDALDIDGATIGERFPDATVDVEAEVVARVGAGSALRALFRWLSPPERYATALMMKGKGQVAFQRRYGIHPQQSRLVWAELRAKLKTAWFALLEGEPLPKNEDSQVLATIRAQKQARLDHARPEAQAQRRRERQRRRQAARSAALRCATLTPSGQIAA